MKGLQFQEHQKIPGFSFVTDLQQNGNVALFKSHQPIRYFAIKKTLKKSKQFEFPKLKCLNPLLFAKCISCRESGIYKYGIFQNYRSSLKQPFVYSTKMLEKITSYLVLIILDLQKNSLALNHIRLENFLFDFQNEDLSLKLSNLSRVSIRNKQNALRDIHIIAIQILRFWIEKAEQFDYSMFYENEKVKINEINGNQIIKNMLIDLQLESPFVSKILQIAFSWKNCYDVDLTYLKEAIEQFDLDLVNKLTNQAEIQREKQRLKQLHQIIEANYQKKLKRDVDLKRSRNKRKINLVSYKCYCGRKYQTNDSFKKHLKIHGCSPKELKTAEKPLNEKESFVEQHPNEIKVVEPVKQGVFDIEDYYIEESVGYASIQSASASSDCSD